MDDLKKAWFALKAVMVANYGQREEMNRFEKLLMEYKPLDEPLPPIPEESEWAGIKPKKRGRRSKKSEGTMSGVSATDVTEDEFSQWEAKEEYAVNNMDEDQIPSNVWEDNEKGEGSD